MSENQSRYQLNVFLISFEGVNKEPIFAIVGANDEHTAIILLQDVVEIGHPEWINDGKLATIDVEGTDQFKSLISGNVFILGYPPEDN